MIAARAVSAEEIGFPFAQQIARIDRRRTPCSRRAAHRPPSKETVYLITSLEPQNASPQRLLELARGHWTIENNLHFCRDLSFDEDRSQIRHPNGAQVMAGLRNLAISLGNLSAASLPTRKRYQPHRQRRYAMNLEAAVRLVTAQQPRRALHAIPSG